MNFFAPRTALFLFLFVAQLLTGTVLGQMRQMYAGTGNADNDIRKISFYTASEGYVAFRDWIGYTQDSGRTFVKKYVQLDNVDYNGYGVNLTFGFGIKGVKAFSRDVLVAYGDYGLVPSILYSTNGGNTFKLVFHSQYSASQLRTGITDMAFPGNGTTGYAIDADRILKTTDKGLTWTKVYEMSGAYYDYIEAVDNNNVYVFSTDFNLSKVLKTTTGGSSWQHLFLPSGQVVNYASFITPLKGWLSTRSNNDGGRLYYTSNGGSSWVLKNNPAVTPFYTEKMKFVNDSTGFALSELFETFKTTDSGRTWEPLPRDNNFTYLGYSHNDLHLWNNEQLWAGGGYGFLELNTNAGSRPLPRAYFVIDTAGLYRANQVQLKNYSKPYYQYRWYVNGVLTSSDYQSSYTHDIYRGADTVQLVVSDGVHTDTASHIQLFNAVPYPPPVVSAFTPTSGGSGTMVTITGNYFSKVTGVSFGGIPATSFTVESLTRITAVVGAGGNGAVSVTTATGTGSLSGFITYPPPVIHSFAPLTAPLGAEVVISGSNFSEMVAGNMVYFGSVRAQVLSASNNQLTVRVPAGATYEPITVTVNNHTAYSPQRFSVLFPATCPFSEYTFDAGKVFDHIYASTSLEGGVSISDLDGDGKSDVIVNDNQGFSIYRNIGSKGEVNFAPSLFIPLGVNTTGVSVGDLDGDGKPDLAVTNTNANTIALYRNTSIPGTISFAARVDVSGGGRPHTIAINDLDGDGKPDMVVSNNGTNVNTVSVYRNISLPGAITFTTRVDVPVGRSPSRVATGDLDGDGKADVFILDYGVLGSNLSSFSVLHNTSSIGIISFAPLKAFQHFTAAPMDANLADVDGDGKLDIGIGYDIRYTINQNKSIGIYRNTSTPGNISFATPVGFGGCSYNESISFSDLDGDGKVDLFAPCWVNGSVRLLKNVGSQGNPSFVSVNSPYMIMPGGFTSSSIADLDGDGKNDLVGVDFWRSTITVFRNSLNDRGALAGKDTTICEGQYLRLGNAARAGHTYAWTSSPAGFSSSSADMLIRPMSDTTYFLTVTDAQGCTTADTVVVRVGGPAPVVNAGADRVSCLGVPKSIGSPATGTFTYSWTSNTGGFTSNEATPAVTPAVGTTRYYLTVNTGSCVAKDTVSITINNPPVANAGQDQQICSSYGVQIGSQPAGSTTYSWTSNPAGFTSTTANPYVYPTENTTYYLFVRDGAGCTARDTVSVAVLASPPMPTISVSGPTSFCQGGSVTLTSSATENIQWYRFGVAIPGATNPVLVVTESGYYYLRVSNANCTVSPPYVDVKVSNPVAAPVISAAGATTFCEGGSVVLSSSAFSGNQWFKDGVAISGAVGATYTATLAGSYTVKAITNGCPSATSNVIVVSINTTTTAPVITVGGATTFCSGGSVVLRSSFSSGNQWLRNGTVIAGAVGQQYTATQSGQYTVQATSGGCAAGISAPVTVTVGTIPDVPVITATGNLLSSSAPNGNQWYIDGVIIVGATGEQYSAHGPGKYTVQVTVNGCSNTSLPFNYVVTAIIDPAVWNGEVSAYPNPVTQKLWIRNEKARRLHLLLIDAFGRKVYEGSLSATVGTIDLVGLGSGVYQLLITDTRKQESITQTVLKL